MSIEKFSGKMNKEDSGCTISINKTTQSIPDIAAAGLYSYLLSKPSGWVISPIEIMNHYGIKKGKVYKHINQLIELKLLTRVPIRENGRFVRFEYSLHLKPHARTDSQPVLEKQEVVKQEIENRDTYKTKKLLQSKEVINTPYIPPEGDEAVASEKPLKPQLPEKDDSLLRELIEIYNHELQNFEVTRHSSKPIRGEVRKTLSHTIKEWNKAFEMKFTKDHFANYLRELVDRKHWLLKPYTTESGNKIIKGIPIICRWDSILRVREEALTERSR